MILHAAASVAAGLAAAGYLCEAVSHPAFRRVGFRIVAVVAILATLGLVEAGVWIR